MAYESETEAEDPIERDDTKLRAARKRFEEACDHHKNAHAEAHRAQQFFHNTEGEGQWAADDIAYLRDQGRPVLTFNIVKPKIETMMGMYADAQRRPVVSSSSNRSRVVADVIDLVKEQVLQDARYERKSARQFRTGVISGESSIQVEVVPSPKGSGWITVNLHRVMPFEVHWDPTSIEPDRSDAGYVFWDRWMNKATFEHAYPEFAAEFDSLMGKGDSDDLSNFRIGESGLGAVDLKEDYRDDDSNHYYADRRKHQIRVIRYEYKEWAPAWFVTDLQSGRREEVTQDQAENAQLAADVYGMPIQMEKTDVERVRVCEFIGSTMLAEYDEAGPFDGFSIVPFTYMIDEETGTAYGFVRNLFDPQQELNTSKSLEIEYIAQGAAPGVTAEKDAIPDEEQFRAELRRPGGVAIVRKGGLSEGAVVPRNPTPPSPAVMARAENSVNLLSEISGIPSASNLIPAEHAQAGVTVAIRYNKSRQSVQDPFSNFEDSQREVVRRVVESITRSMPDDQIAAILGSEDRFVIQGGQLIEVEEGPNGQKVPKSQADLRMIRDMDWKLEFEHTTENSTLRMMQLQVMLEMKQAGVPIDPEMIVEKATTSRTDRERLRKYAREASQAAAMAADREAKTFEGQTRGMLMIEGMKAQEAARHNQRQEELTSDKQQKDAAMRLLDIWEKADDNEKALMFSTLQLAHQNDMAKRQEVSA
jgi:hypothetical protein